MFGDERVQGQYIVDGAPERARALAVHDADGGEPGEERVVEVLFQERPRFVGRPTDQVQLAADAAACRARSRGRTARRRAAVEAAAVTAGPSHPEALRRAPSRSPCPRAPSRCRRRRPPPTPEAEVRHLDGVTGDGRSRAIARCLGRDVRRDAGRISPIRRRLRSRSARVLSPWRRRSHSSFTARRTSPTSRRRLALGALHEVAGLPLGRVELGPRAVPQARGSRPRAARCSPRAPRPAGPRSFRRASRSWS